VVAVASVGGRKRQPSEVLGRPRHRLETTVREVQEKPDALGRLTIVPMMQPANHGFRADRSEFWWFDGAWRRTVLLQSEMSLESMIVGEVLLKDPAQVSFADDEVRGSPRPASGETSGQRRAFGKG
jgi:hypothetical protein